MPKEPSMKLQILIIRVAAAAALLGCAGCTHTLKATCNYGTPATATLRCPVSLSLSHEYSKYEHHTPGVFLVHDGFDVSFGPALCEYAIYVARSVFGDVQVLDGSTPVRSESKLLLTPRVTSSSLQPPVDSSATGAMGVQWTFADPKTGKVLFAMPVQCEYRAPWKLFGPPISSITTELMQELGGTTVKRFSSSREIQCLAGHGDAQGK
jgi:hypothetical protein